MVPSHVKRIYTGQVTQNPTNDCLFPCYQSQLWQRPTGLEKQKQTNGLKSINHKQQMQPFKPVEVSFYFLRGPLR